MTRPLTDDEFVALVAGVKRAADDLMTMTTNSLDANIHDYVVTVLEQAAGIELWRGTEGALERIQKALARLMAAP